MSIYNAESMPCINFPVKYGIRLKLYFAITAITCICTLIPAKPTINAVRISFSAIGADILEIFTVPVVNSIIPESRAYKVPLNGKKSRRILLIILKNITAPQTVKMFFIALLRAILNISPTLRFGDVIIVGSCTKLFFL